MRRSIILLIFLPAFLMNSFGALGQDVPQATQEQLENLTDAQQADIEDDSYLEQLGHFKKHPLNLNDAGPDELRELIFLTDLQIDHLISYRNLLGRFISIYELQSLPSWDIITIKKILPYVTVDNTPFFTTDIKKIFSEGDQNLVFRFSETLENSKGFDKSTSGTKYAGGKERLFFRYHYRYKDLLQYGVVGDKDAGEQFFKGAQKYGFDFYSFHLFARKMGKIQALALGDFTVNMGQGLIQWQSLAFSKSAEVMNVKRQSAILRPYTSSGEFYFHRGAGVTMQFGKWETTAFTSIRKLSSNFVADTVNREDFISSLQTSGYHRTQNEIDNRNNLRQLAFGGNLAFRENNWHIGFNGIAYYISLPLIKRAEPYNLFAINGKSWNNFSIDYSYTHRNFHFFGEGAIDKNLHSAFLNGLLISVDPKIDLSLVQRAIDKKYQAVYGDAFTENIYPTNENGLYAGASVRPGTRWQIGMYADFYKFPWLKYLTDAPSYGKDFLVQFIFTPNKQVEIYSRFRSEAKQTNQPSDTAATSYIASIPKQSWRTEINYRINPAITLRERIEMVWYDRNGWERENGFLGFFDFVYRPLLKKYSGNIRVQYFETGGYSSRVYAYENDIPGVYSIPAFFDKGYRYYINLSYDLRKNLSLWLRGSQTIYHGKTSIGSGLDEIPKNHLSTIEAEGSILF